MKLSVLLPVLASTGMAHDLICPASGELRGTVPSSGRKQGFATMKEAHEILLACPNIKTLNLRLALMGCSEWPDRWNFPFRLAGGEVYPNLTSLTLEDYKFNQSDWADASPRSYWPSDLLNWVNFHAGLRTWFPLWRDTPVERRHLTNLQLWLAAMDWAQLESLTLIDTLDAHFLALAMPRLAGLTSLEIRGTSRWPGGGACHAALRPVSALPADAALARFAWVGRWDPRELAPLLDRCGRTLTRLELYAPEPRPGPAANASQIAAVGAGAPGLAHLTLSLDRDGSWPWDVLRALAGVRSLVSADVWLELAAEHMRGASEHWGHRPPHDDDEAGRDGSPFREPRLNATSATEVFSYMLRHNESSNLRNVTFYIGDWGRSWDGPLRIPPWLDGRRGKVECSLYNEQGERKKPGEALCVHTVGEEGGFVWDDGPVLEGLYVGEFEDEYDYEEL